MSNNVKPRVWVLDTASNTADLWSGGPVCISKMEWKPSAGAQTLLVKDRAANVIWSKTSLAAAPAGDEVWEAPSGHMTFNGFILHTMTTGGTLYVYTV